MGSSCILQKLCSKIKPRQLFYSFECIPVAESNGYFMSLINSLTQIQPLFVSIPWHLKGRYDVTQLQPLIAAITMQSHGLEALLNLATTGLTEENILEILTKAKAAGIKNIFALRGDRTENSPPSEFQHACDLVRFIRKHFSEEFTICVAGYPNGHPECISYLDDLKYLKQKVDAGANFIITQIFFDSRDFIQFENDCRKIGIKVPIIPGIMTIQSCRSAEIITRLCKVKIPEKILTEIKSLKDDEMVTKYGISKAVEMISDILKSSTSIRAVHFFTLNRFHPSCLVKTQIEEFYSENI